MSANRKYPIGAEPLSEGLVSFRVWAPHARCLELMLESEPPAPIPLRPVGNGYFSFEHSVPVGTKYRFRIDGAGPFPDPASRFQPDGPHGPSEVVDPLAFRWTDQDWKGITPTGQVVYEIHIGTFTKEGTWQSAAKLLPELAAMGITCLEIMPICEFPGQFGWGYDGVDLFAPSHLYGRPDDFRSFVDQAHCCGIGVILDVVYNHIGPDGNYLGQYTRQYFSTRHRTDWGEAINFDGEGSQAVREFFLTNAAYWIDEFHLDGLRLDATQNIYDDSPAERHILTEIGRVVRKSANGRATYIVNENECQHAQLVRPVEKDGYGLDSLWNDDYHHSAMVALTGKAEAYYTNYRGQPQELISALKNGFLYQGQWYSWQKQRRGLPALDLPPHAFVNFLQNHDQIANSARGLRAHLLTSPGRYRALHALTLLGPGTPMLFQGQEFESSAPFLYFADHQPELAEKVKNGRLKFLSQFPSLRDEAMAKQIALPHEHETFARCKLDFDERESHAPAYALTKDLLQLRKSDAAFRNPMFRGIDGAVLGPDAFVMRYFVPDGHDRLIVVNLGRLLDLQTCPEPLLAPPADCQWTVALSTEDPRYGGNGIVAPESSQGIWLLPAESATVFIPTTLSFSGVKCHDGNRT